MQITKNIRDKMLVYYSPFKSESDTEAGQSLAPICHQPDLTKAF